MLLENSVFFITTLVAITQSEVYTAQEKVPAIIGKKLQLRCSMIFNNVPVDAQDGKGYYYRVFYPEDHVHTWKRNGQIMNDPLSTHYVVENSLTYGYCDLIDGTEDLLNKMNISTDAQDWSMELSRQLQCLSTVLTIYSVSEDDLGEYECNVEGDKYGREKKEKLTITVFNDASETDEDDLPKIAYYKKGVDQGIISKILLQCVVENGPVFWYIHVKDGKFPLTLDEALVSDTWRCFTNARTKSHKVGNVTESFAHFENVCRSDAFLIYCSADSKRKVHEITRLSLGTVRGDFTSYESEQSLLRIACVAIPVLVSFFFALAGIIGFRRADMCKCCTSDYNASYSQALTHQIVAPISQFRPPVYNIR